MKKSTNSANLQHNFDPSQVLYLTGDVNYCFVCLDNGKRILTSRTLKWYNERWPFFVRSHKGYLVNPKAVLDCVLTSAITAYLVISNGDHLPISRRRISDVSDRLSLAANA